MTNQPGLIVEATDQSLFLSFKKMAAESFIKNQTRIILAPDMERSVYRIQLSNLATGEIIKQQYLSKVLFNAITHLDEFWDEDQARQMQSILKNALQHLDRIMDKKESSA